MNPKYPKRWLITCTLDSPAEATEQDVRRILRMHMKALKVLSVEPETPKEEGEQDAGSTAKA